VKPRVGARDVGVWKSQGFTARLPSRSPSVSGGGQATDALRTALEANGAVAGDKQ